MSLIAKRDYPRFLAELLLETNAWFDILQCEVYKVSKTPEGGVGLLSISDLQACRDIKATALEEANALETYLGEHGWKVDGMKEFLALRGRLGLNEHNVAKLRLEEEPVDVSRLRHLLFLKLYAFKPLLDTATKLWDLDGIYDDVFPSFSDMSVANTEDGLKMAMIDFSFATIQLKDVGERLTLLENYFSALEGECYLVHLKVKQDDLRSLKLENLEFPRTFPADGDYKDYVDLCHYLNIAHQDASPKEMEELEAAIDQIINPILSGFLDGLERTKDQMELLAEECRELFLIIQDQGLVAKILESLRCRNFEEPTLLANVLDILEEEEDRFPNLLALFQTLANDFIMHNWHDPYRHPLAIPLNEQSDKRKLLAWACKQDIIFHCVMESLKDENMQAVSNGVCFDTEMRMRPLPYGVSFDRPQTTATSFPANVICYIRRPYFTEEIYRIPGQESFLTKDDYQRMAFQANAENDDKRRSELSAYIKQEEVRSYKGVQLMVNTTLYPDKDYIKFISRHNHRTLKEVQNHVSDLSTYLEEIKKSSDYMKHFLEDSLYTPEEAVFHRRCLKTPLAKARIVYGRKCMPSLKSKLDLNEQLFLNKPMSYLAQKNEFARTLSSALKLKTPANYVELLDSSSYCSIHLIFINSPATNFKTTWYKTISVNAGVPSEFFESGNLYPSQAYAEEAHVEETRYRRTRCESPFRLIFPGEEYAGYPNLPVYVEASRWTSVDRNNLNWDIEAFSKAFVRVGNLLEMREESYLMSKYYEGGSNERKSFLEMRVQELRLQKAEILSASLKVGTNWAEQEEDVEEETREMDVRIARVLLELDSIEQKRDLLTDDDHNTLKAVRRIYGERFPLKESIINITPFLINRQQFSVISTALKFLHQGVGSLNYDPRGTLRKLKGLKMVSFLEVDYNFKMSYNYIMALIMRLGSTINLVRATNKEIYYHMPDLLLASSNPHLNVSAFSTNTNLNVNKIWRTTSEANNVLALMDQKRKIDQVKLEDPDLYWGAPKSEIHGLASVLESEYIANKTKTAAERSSIMMKSIRIFLSSNKASVAVVLDKILKRGGGQLYLSSFWFNYMVCLKSVKTSGKFSSLSSLAGKGIANYFTTKGSLNADTFDDNLEQHSLRRASASMSLLAQCHGFSGDKTGQNMLFKLSTEMPDGYVDEYYLACKFLDGELKVVALMQISEKDAYGKDREISTLHVTFGTLCLIAEHLAMRKSELTEEDLVLERNKELAINRMVNAAYNLKTRSKGSMVVFKNGDKSSYGPSAKSCNMFLEAATFCPDQSTYRLFEKALVLNMEKKIRYPHNLIKESLRLQIKGNSYYENNKLKLADGYSRFMFDNRTTTGSVMNLIQEQYVKGNDLGEKGTTYCTITDGFPGQGIFTINSSIKHAAVLAYINDLLKARYSWVVASKVTSDDDMCSAVIPETDLDIFLRVYRRAQAGVLSLAGLIDNSGKFVITFFKPELNQVFHLGRELSVPSWKMASANTALNSTANLQEDLLRAVSAGSSTVKSGGSFFCGTLVAAANMAMVLDAHHAWDLYHPLTTPFSRDPGTGEVTMLMDLPVEAFGIPRINVALNLLSPLGVRVASSASEANLSDDNFWKSYATYILSTSLLQPFIEEQNVPTDLAHHYNADGEVLIFSSKTGQFSKERKVRKIPNITGLSSRLRRRKGLSILKAELDQDLVAKEADPRRPPDQCHLGSLLDTILDNLHGPISAEKDLPQPHVQLADLTHSVNYKNVKVLPNCLFDFKSKTISRKELYKELKREGVVLELAANFEKHIKNSLEVELPPWAENLLVEVVRETTFLREANEVLWQARLIKDSTNFPSADFMKQQDGSDVVMKRLIHLQKGFSSLLDKNRLFYLLLSNFIKENDVSELHPSQVRNLLGKDIRGTLSLPEAFKDAKLLTDNILSLFPQNLQVIAYSHAILIDTSDKVMEFFKRNVYYGTEAKLSKGLFSEWENSRPTLDLLEDSLVTDLVDKARVFSIDCISSKLQDYPFVNDRPKFFGAPGARLEGLSELSYHTHSFEVPWSIYNSAIKNMDVALLLAYSKGTTGVNGRYLINLLDASTHFGWYGNSLARRKMIGPLASFENIRGDHVLLYDQIEEQLVWDSAESVSVRNFTHNLWWTADPMPFSKEEIKMLGNQEYIHDLLNRVLSFDEELNYWRLTHHAVASRYTTDSFIDRGVLRYGKMGYLQLASTLVTVDEGSGLEIPVHRLPYAPMVGRKVPRVYTDGPFKLKTLMGDLAKVCKMHPQQISYSHLENYLMNDWAFECANLDPLAQQAFLMWSSEVLRTLGASLSSMSNLGRLSATLTVDADIEFLEDEDTADALASTGEDKEQEEMDFLISKMRTAGLDLKGRLQLSSTIVRESKMQYNIPLLIASYAFVELSKGPEQTREEHLSGWMEDVALEHIKDIHTRTKKQKTFFSSNIYNEILDSFNPLVEAKAGSLEDLVRRSMVDRVEAAAVSGETDPDEELHQMMLAHGRKMKREAAEAEKEEDDDTLFFDAYDELE